MPQLLIIKAETAQEGLQYIGDVLLEVFEDDQWFPPNIYEQFNVLQLNGTKADVEAKLRQIIPKTARAWLWSDGKYRWNKPPDPPGIGEEVISVYRVEGDIKWYKLVTDFKFPANVEDLTPEEKQLLATIDINHPSVNSFIRKIVKDLTTQPGNDVEIKELKNTSP